LLSFTWRFIAALSCSLITNFGDDSMTKRRRKFAGIDRLLSDIDRLLGDDAVSDVDTSLARMAIVRKLAATYNIDTEIAVELCELYRDQFEDLIVIGSKVDYIVTTIHKLAIADGVWPD
jgi:hypothetical protein